MGGFISKDEYDGNKEIAVPQRLRRFKAQIKKIKQNLKAFEQEKKFFDEFVVKQG